MRKTYTNRAFLATAEGVQWWEVKCSYAHPTDAAKALSVPVRSYFRWKSQGLPTRFQRELILDRMESEMAKTFTARKRRG
jgi:hypothetical protein